MNHAAALNDTKTRILFTTLLFTGMVLFLATAASGLERYDSGKNYCGPKIDAYNRTLPNPVPSKPIPGVSFNYPCYEHDKCYELCSSNCKTQSMCDKEFKARLENICKTKSRIIRPSCMDLARTYYHAVDKAGRISYHCGNPPCPSNYTLAAGNPGPDQALFFENSDYGGSFISFSKGTNVADLTKWNTPTGSKWNDRISSIKVGSGVRVLIYEHTNFGGRCMTLSSSRNYPYMDSQNANLSGSENWNDRISSFKVTEPNQVCP